MSIEDDVRPKVMSPEELAYRKELRDAILSVTNIVIQEHQEEIVRRAEERIKFQRAMAKE